MISHFDAPVQGAIITRLPDSRRLVAAGAAYLLSILALVLTRTPLGSPLFFACVVVAAAAYAAVLPLAWRPPVAPRRALTIAFLFAVAFRVPLAVAPVGPDSDMVRYVWDGRVQHFGYNPYKVVPADAAVAHTHTAETRQMPSLRWRTPYPPAAQLFFRAVVGVHDSTRAMKLALVACDLLTMVVLWRLLEVIGRSPWLAVVYAWNPLVVLEVAHSGHIDALGALWIVASVYFLARRYTGLASIAFVLAVATKLLPIVLAPLYWRRVRVRDGMAGGALMVFLYALYADDLLAPLGAVPSVVSHFRFNGPVFRTVAAVAGAHAGAAVAVGAGLALAVWVRRRLAADDPAAWAWPMAASLVCAPVIYPWYLLYFTPFLWARAAAPLIVWTLSVLPVYLVWHLPDYRRLWTVPWYVELLEYGAVLGCGALLVWRVRRPVRSPETPEVKEELA